jgi:glycosyltransferase involved in cell wall biosynthesis
MTTATRLPITAVVLTKNEQRNLPECLASVRDWVQDILVVDSLSSDATLEIAGSHGARILQRPWKNHADQFQWALDHGAIHTPWVVRLDADERWTDEGFRRLAPLLSESEVAGINVRMQIYFMGRFLRHGGLYPNDFLRVFRREGSRMEQRWMDEHITVSGATVSPGIDVIESNYDRQQNIGLWTAKHNDYSTREAVDILMAKWHLGRIDSVADLRGGRTARKRWFKENVYWRTPLFVRPLLYFLYRYVIKLGFLDGTRGLIFHVLQGFWYRTLVDVKVYQLEGLARDSGRPLVDVIRDSYGIELEGA